jgi:hypothetical protein
VLHHTVVITAAHLQRELGKQVQPMYTALVYTSPACLLARIALDTDVMTMPL